MTPSPSNDANTKQLLRRYIDRCDEFGPPDLLKFLKLEPGLTSRQQADLVLVDQGCRWLSGVGVQVEDYVNSFPALFSDDDLLLEVIVAEFNIFEEMGRRPNVKEFRDRFPTLGERLVSVLDSEAEPAFLSRARIIRDVMARADLGSTVSMTHLDPRPVQPGEGDATLPLQTEEAPTPRTGSGTSLLPRCEFFSTLPQHVVHLLEMYMHEQEYPAGAYLMKQDAVGDALMVLYEGSVEISTCNKEGKETVITRTSRVQVLGEMALLAEETRSASVLALTNTKVLVLPAQRFHEVAAQHPVLCQVLSMLVATRLGRPDRQDVLAGKTFENYIIRRRLGRGGMSVVYAAKDTVHDRDVALKMMSHRLVYDAAALAQFQREADIVESFDHPNLVRMFGRLEAFHTYFIVMEYCDGETLSKAIRRKGPLPEHVFRNILGQVAAALAYAHSKGVVHQDIKPSNIMLTRNGVVKLMDFGLAKAISEGLPNQGDPIVGTPRYMAPEQSQGGAITSQTDYFSFGCVAYEMMTGKALFPDNTVAGLIERVRLWESCDTTQLRPDFPPDIHDFLFHALQKNPLRRGAALAQLAADAKPIDVSFFSETPVASPPPVESPTERGSDFFKQGGAKT